MATDSMSWQEVKEEMQRRKDNKGRVLRKGEYQRKDGSYMYVYKTDLGKKRTVYARTLKDLRAKEDEITRDVLEGINPDGARVTVNDFYERWKSARALDVKAEVLRENTFANYCYMYEQFVMSGFGDARLKDVTPARVEAFYKTLITERGLKLHTVDAVHVPLCQVLQLAEESNYIRRNPASGAMRKVKQAYRKKEVGIPSDERALTVEQQELLLSFVRDHEAFGRWYPMLLVFVKTGMRVGELTGLRRCDVDMEHDVISVNHTLVHYSKGKGLGVRYAINETKTPSGKRTIPMLPEVREAFALEFERQEREGVKPRMVIDGYGDFVFVNRFGDCLNQGTINKALKRIVRDCNFAQLDKGESVLLPNFSCHWLRHTFTTRLNEQNVNIKAAQALLGHREGSNVTLDVYTAAQDEFVRSELLKIADQDTNPDTNDLQTFTTGSHEGSVRVA